MRWISTCFVIPGLLAIGLLQSGLAQAEDPLSGRATVIDGSTLEIDGTVARFAGVVAPARAQTCDRNGIPWSCGDEAAQRLGELIDKHEVRCSVVGRDFANQPVVVCFSGTVELNRAMVADGYAVSKWQFGLDYQEAQAIAKASRIGLWSGNFIDPLLWRQQHTDASGKPAS